MTTDYYTVYVQVDFSTSDEVNFPPSSRLHMLRLERQYGLRSVALKWFSSYLPDRTFRVVYTGLYVINCLHSMFRDTRLSARAAPVVHSGPGRPRR